MKDLCEKLIRWGQETSATGGRFRIFLKNYAILYHLQISINYYSVNLRIIFDTNKKDQIVVNLETIMIRLEI